MFASPGRTLKDAHVPRLHDVQSTARVAFPKDQFASAEFALHDARGQEGKLLLRQTGEYGNTFQHLERGSLLVGGHGDDFTRYPAPRRQLCFDNNRGHSALPEESPPRADPPYGSQTGMRVNTPGRPTRHTEFHSD